jgi:selenium metabolism protein YedF
MITINMIGQPCPIPVVEAKKALAQKGTQGIIVLVDNSIAVQNLEKMATGLGYGFSSEKKGETEYAVSILVKDSESNSAIVSQVNSEMASCSVVSDGVTFLLTGDQIGISGEEAGKKLMKTFLYSLAQLANAPKNILLLNQGVKLACEGSEVLDEMKNLAEKTDIRSCGQCLNFYGLIEKLLVGKITNMLDIVETITSSAKTITI